MTTAMTIDELASLGAFVVPEDDGTLRYVGLRGPNCGDACIDLLNRIPPLESLGVIDAPVSPSAIRKYRHLIALKSFGCVGIGITDEYCEVARMCGTLEGLTFEATSISDEGIKSLGKQPHLCDLLLCENRISGRALSGLGPMPRLNRLYLQDTDVGDELCECFEHVPSLQQLLLKGSKITNALLYSIQHLSNLELLGLQDTAISDSGVLTLKGLTKLKSIYLDNTSVTTMAIDALWKNLSIQEVHVAGTRVSEAHVQRFLRR